MVEGDVLGRGAGVVVEVGLGSVEILGSGSGFAAIFISTPLFQMSFFPDLIQVNFEFAIVFVVPAFVHLVPAIVAEVAGTNWTSKLISTTEIRLNRLTGLCTLEAYSEREEEPPYKPD